MNLNRIASMYGRLLPRERLPLAMSALDRGDTAEFERLLRSGQTSDRDGMVMINILALVFITEQLEYAFAYRDFTDRAECLEDSAWKYLSLTAAYMFAINAEGWKQFCAEMNVDAECLVDGNYRGFMLRLAREWMPPAPAQEEVKQAARKAKPELPADFNLVTADALRNGRLHIMAEIDGFESLGGRNGRN
jgi:hypothetical protein